MRMNKLLSLSKERAGSCFAELGIKYTVPGYRSETHGNYVLGTERFQAEVERTPRRRVTRGDPGRPRKVESDREL